jgi:hypothetical protein
VYINTVHNSYFIQNIDTKYEILKLFKFLEKNFWESRIWQILLSQKFFQHIFDMKYEICKEYILCISITKSSLTPKLSKKKKSKFQNLKEKTLGFLKLKNIRSAKWPENAKRKTTTHLNQDDNINKRSAKCSKKWKILLAEEDLADCPRNFSFWTHFNMKWQKYVLVRYHSSAWLVSHSNSSINMIILLFWWKISQNVKKFFWQRRIYLIVLATFHFGHILTWNMKYVKSTFCVYQYSAQLIFHSKYRHKIWYFKIIQISWKKLLGEEDLADCPRNFSFWTHFNMKWEKYVLMRYHNSA